MTESELDKLGNGVKDIRQGNGSMSDLEFDPTTGEFKQVPKGTADPGKVVTTLTKEGFA